MEITARVTVCRGHTIDLYNEIHSYERDIILEALKECGWVIAHTARMLKMERTTLRMKMNRFEIIREAS